MASHALSLLPISTSANRHSSRKQQSIHSFLKLDTTNFISSFTGTKISVSYSNSRQFTPPRHSSTVATISVSLPTAYFSQKISKVKMGK